MHQTDHHRDLDKRSDNGGKGGAAVDAKYRHGRGDREFEVVARGGERKGGGFG